VILVRVPAAAGPLRIGFYAFAAFACASGAKALRAKAAPRFFFLALAVAAVLGVLVWRIAP
jgi:hypothetical protein